MGMDVSGKAPTSERGSYFRANVWWWRPLADYVEEMYPGYYVRNKYWHSNDGGGLNARDSKSLGEAIQKDIDEGRAMVWLCERETRLQEMPDKVCDLCEGTGRRLAPPETGAGDFMECNSCKGKGSKRPWETHYHCNIESLQDFANFLKECGGFEIW